MQKNLQNLLKNKKLIKNGYNHDVFSSEVEGCKYVVHQGRSERDSGSDLNNTNSVLRFLESREITFVPKIVHFDTSKDLLIQSYVGMEDVVFVELSLDELDVFMHHLALIHSFTEAEVRQFCINRNVSMLRVHTPEESLRIFGEERFEAVKKTCPDKDVLSWIAPHLAENITLVKTLTQQKKPVLQMGDIGGNLRTGGGELYLIDWEFSCFGYDHELAYIKIHSYPTEEQFACMVKQYAHYSGVSVGVLWREIQINEKITRVNDVIWAAMKWGKNIDNLEVVKKYKDLTFKRIALYEAL